MRFQFFRTPTVFTFMAVPIKNGLSPFFHFARVASGKVSFLCGSSPPPIAVFIPTDVLRQIFYRPFLKTFWVSSYRGFNGIGHLLFRFVRVFPPRRANFPFRSFSNSRNPFCFPFRGMWHLLSLVPCRSALYLRHRGLLSCVSENLCPHIAHWYLLSICPRYSTERWCSGANPQLGHCSTGTYGLAGVTTVLLHPTEHTATHVERAQSFRTVPI